MALYHAKYVGLEFFFVFLIANMLNFVLPLYLLVLIVIGSLFLDRKFVIHM